MLLEKPFALTAPDCDGMIAAAKASGRILMLAHVCRFWGDYVSLVEFVQSGRIGKPLSANASRLSQLPAWATWFLDPALSGGAVLDLSVHDFDIVNWVLGTPKTAYGRGHEYRPGLWNDIHAEIDYGGANGFVEGSEFMPEGYPFSCSLRVICEGGVAEFSFRAGGVSVEMGGGSSLMVYEAGKACPLHAEARRRLPEPGRCLRRLRARGTRADARHRRAGAACGAHGQRGAPVVRDGAGGGDLRAEAGDCVVRPSRPAQEREGRLSG